MSTLWRCSLTLAAILAFLEGPASRSQTTNRPATISDGCAGFDGFAVDAAAKLRHQH
jgi:hypothetical protein